VGSSCRYTRTVIGMTLLLRPMGESEFSEFLVSSREGYIASRVTSGEDPLEAARAVNEMSREMFPGDKPGPGHVLYTVEEDGTRVGSLWLGPPSDGRPDEWWVWDIVIEESCRGRGLGKACMLLAEREVSARGATHLGLTVFGHNPVARHLYESLGYSAVYMRMSKTL
jgi:ribosomal protein S18 acetylase RimI-like enzyme